MSIELKIKSKSLSAEASIIRIEERRARAARKTELLTSLHLHRVTVVRWEARATYLARAYLAGQSYSTVEASTKHCKENEFWSRVFPRIVTMVNRYGLIVSKEQVKNWINTRSAVEQ